jgi:histone acetyltransferase (RNA polymerase elongator complex component)
VVVTGSLLADWYRNGDFAPWSLDRAVTHTAELAGFFMNNDIQVIRMGLQSTTDLQPGDTILAGPWHPAFGHLVYARIFLEKATELLAARIEEMGGNTLSKVVFRVHPRSESRLRGDKNGNIKALKVHFGLKIIIVERDSNLPENKVEVS